MDELRWALPGVPARFIDATATDTVFVPACPVAVGVNETWVVTHIDVNLQLAAGARADCQLNTPGGNAVEFDIIGDPDGEGEGNWRGWVPFQSSETISVALSSPASGTKSILVCGLVIPIYGAFF